MYQRLDKRMRDAACIFISMDVAVDWKAWVRGMLLMLDTMRLQRQTTL